MMSMSRVRRGRPRRWDGKLSGIDVSNFRLMERNTGTGNSRHPLIHGPTVACDMSDYMVSRKRKRHAVDPCLGFYLLSSGKVVSSPSSKSASCNISPNFGINALAACTEFHEDTLVPSSIENELGTGVSGDVSHNQHPNLKLPDCEHQLTPKHAGRTQVVNLRRLDSENLNSSSNIASDLGQPMMTVEDFLKRSTKKETVAKNQNRGPKGRIKRLDNNGALFKTEGQHEILGSDTGDASQGIMQLRTRKIRRATMYESSSDESSSLIRGESSPLEIKRTRKKTRGRILKPLKERLFEAAVLTHGDPDDILVHGPTASSELAPSRRPLRFVPNIQPELDGNQTDKHSNRPQTWSFIDPRKSTAISTASFSSKIRPCLQHMNLTFTGKSANLSVQPPKRWKFTDDSLSLGNLKSNRQPKISPVKKAYNYPRLTFVSLKEAEEDYKSIFSSSHKRNGLSADVRKSTLPMVSVAESASYAEGRMSNPIDNLHMVPLEEVIQNPNFSIEASPQVAVDEIITLDNLKDMPSASLNSSPIINSVSSPTALALPVTPKSTQDRPIPIAPARHGSLRADVSESASMRRGSDVTSKPMRPLASFFNEFIQNIRNVTVSQDQSSLSDRHQVSKRPLRKSSRNGIFDSQQPWANNDLESIRQNDPNYRDHMNLNGQPERTPDLPYNHRLSPDILTLLEPQNYQVILSSPS